MGRELLKPQAKNTAAGQPLALAAQAIPAGISPLVQNKNALKIRSLPVGRGATVFFHSEAEFSLKDCAGQQGPLPLEKERGLVHRQQEPNFSPALGRQSACGLPATTRLLTRFYHLGHAASASLITT